MKIIEIKNKEIWHNYFKKVIKRNISQDWNYGEFKSDSKNTKAKSIEYGVLKVQTVSPTWRQELHLQKNEIINKLNKKIQKKIIKDIRFI